MFHMEKIFKEYDETTGVGDLLFVNMSRPNQYRFYCRRKTWDECYMVEFCSDSDDYTWYWGHNDCDRGLIDVTPVLLPSYPDTKWKRVDIIRFFPFNLTQIVESIGKNMSKQK